MSDERETPRASHSRAYARASRRARALIEQPGGLSALAASAGEKAAARSGALAGIGKSVQDALRLVRAYASGAYREIPWQSLLMLVAAVVYFVMPVDAVPDILLGFGLLDDAAILGWTLRSLDGDLKRFRAWEATRTAADAPADLGAVTDLSSDS
ncbi:MAG TPA: methyltransferase type 11 [Haliea salexigens]|uniref:Methyltransferase type 11 n=1 Tax=Haliea salexigens TaxID=287487 RepID=A0A3C1KQR0_9GAMM|nr:methyltransferase type 11 [Haliea sp.]HAN29050.1 methyltransferase type 11 [Haliea salexigens]|tara:strand:- start:36241 stop:36705 length:465 start_codon:yes stop_codon:yes gene_type:complete